VHGEIETFHVKFVDVEETVSDKGGLHCVGDR
jgi:hypothetical protein